MIFVSCQCAYEWTANDVRQEVVVIPVRIGNMTVNDCTTLAILHSGMIRLMVPWLEHSEMVLFP